MNTMKWIPNVRQILVTAWFFSILLSGCSTTSPGPEGTGDTLAAFEKSDLEPEEILGRADSFRGLGKTNDALFYYAAYLEHDPKDPKVLNAIGGIHLEKGNLDLAQVALEMSLEADPESASTLEALGLVLFQRGDHDRAKPLLETAAGKDRERWRSENALGLMADRASRHDEAVLHFREALKTVPSNERVANNLAYSLYLKGDVRGALMETDRILERNTKYEPAIMNRGLYLLKLGRAEEALAAFRTVVSESDAWNNLGYFSMQLGDFERARGCFQRAIALSTHYHDLAHRNLDLLDRKESSNERQDALLLSSAPH